MSIFQSTFPKEIQNQLKARGTAFKTKSINALNFINSRQAWARMTSGVDVRGSSTLAQNHILYGGVKYGLGESSNNSYSNHTLGIDGLVSNQRGIRPMPGIQSVTVNTQSAYGSYRKATVKWVCHDIKQLEALEPLFMRPGYTVLLEYGWTPYIRYNGANELMLETRTKGFDMFNPPPGTLVETMYSLYNDNLKEDGNYDAFLGIVSNFEWNAREDGGYDCTTMLTSVGEAIESLKTNFTPLFSDYSNNGILYGYFEKLSNDETYLERLKKYKTVILDNFKNSGTLTNICSELIAYGFAKTQDNNVAEGKNWIEEDIYGDITGEKGHKMCFYRLTYNSGVQVNTDSQKNVIEEDEHVYIDLETFIKILQRNLIPNVTPNDPNNKLFGLSLKGRKNVPEEIDANGNPKDLECLYHFLQISVNPNVCLIRNDNFSKIQKIRLEVKDSGDLLNLDNNTGQSAIGNKLNRDKLNLAKNTINEYCNYSRQDGDINTSKLSSIINRYYEQFGAVDRTTLVQANEYLENAWWNYKQMHYRVYKIIPTNDSRDARQEKRPYVSYSFIGPTNTSLDVSGSDAIIKNAVAYSAQNIMEATNFFREALAKIRNKVRNLTFNDLMLRDLDDELSDIIKKRTKQTYTNGELRRINREVRVDENLRKVSEDTMTSREKASDTEEELADIDKRIEFLTKLDKKYYDNAINVKNAKIGSIYINLKYALSLSISSTLHEFQNYLDFQLLFEHLTLNF